MDTGGRRLLGTTAQGDGRELRDVGEQSELGFTDQEPSPKGAEQHTDGAAPENSLRPPYSWQADVWGSWELWRTIMRERMSLNQFEQESLTNLAKRLRKSPEEVTAREVLREQTENWGEYGTDNLIDMSHLASKLIGMDRG